MTIQIGLGLPQLGPHVTPAVVRSFCKRAEELGYASLWVQEHLFYPTPGRASDGIALYGEMAEVVTTGQRVVPRRLHELGFEFRYPALEPALRDVLLKS